MNDGVCLRAHITCTTTLSRFKADYAECNMTAINVFVFNLKPDIVASFKSRFDDGVHMQGVLLRRTQPIFRLSQHAHEFPDCLLTPAGDTGCKAEEVCICGGNVGVVEECLEFECGAAVGEVAEYGDEVLADVCSEVANIPDASNNAVPCYGGLPDCQLENPRFSRGA